MPRVALSMSIETSIQFNDVYIAWRFLIQDAKFNQNYRFELFRPVTDITVENNKFRI